MTLPNQLSAYDDCFDLFDRALADAVGARSLFSTRNQAFVMQMRMHQARALQRSEATRIYSKDDPRHGKSEYDRLRVTIRRGAEPDLPEGWWVYVERYGIDVITTRIALGGKMKDEILHEILERALTEELGLHVNTNNPASLHTQLNIYRREIADPRYDELIIAVPSIPDHLFIHRRSVSLDP